jgi:predicted RNase H-like nuclease (RuvC/YqgF family)
LESFVITWRELLLVAVLVLAVYIAEMLLLMRSAKPRGWRIWKRGEEAHAQAQVQAKNREVQSLELEFALLHEQVDKLQKELEQLKAQQAAVTPYTHAIQMAQQGLNVNEVAASCGISRGEAELIVALHRNQSP